MILSVSNIHKSYGKEKVTKGISFQIEEPQIVALVGPNGSGKSTLLNIITNLLRADSGEVTILNKSNKDPNLFREVSFMQDNSVLYDYLTGYDHLQFIGDIQRISKEQIVATAELVGMDSYMDKKVGNYSLGMKQHLLLTMAIVNQPKLLILDEPLNGLDPTSAINVRKLLLELHKKGTAILLSSHNLAEIDRVTSHVLFLKDGKLIKEDLSIHEQTRYAIFLDNCHKAYSLLKEANINVEVAEKHVRVFSSDSLPKVFQLFNENDIPILDIEKKVFGTEDRYQRLFEKTGDNK